MGIRKVVGITGLCLDYEYFMLRASKPRDMCSPDTHHVNEKQVSWSITNHAQSTDVIF